MKKFFILIILSLIYGCSSDDSVDGVISVTVDSLSHDTVTISWQYTAGDNVVYEIVLDGVEIADDYSGNQYEFTDLMPGTTFNGKVFAKPQNGNIAFADFTFTTEFFNVSITNQNDVNNFNLTSINGTLFITGNEVTDISGLSEIISVGGLVVSNTGLQSLNGLENLSQFYNGTGRVYLSDNAQLSDVTALTNLSNVTGTLVLNNNTVLTDFTGLSVLPGGSLEIRESPITDFSYFSNLQDLNRLLFHDMPNITSLADFSGLTNLNLLVLEELPSLQSFSGLETITEYKQVTLKFLASITDFSGFSSVTRIDFLDIYRMDGITSLSGFDNLTTANDIFIFQADQMTSLDGTSLTGNNVAESRLRIGFNNSLTDYCGLNAWFNNVDFEFFWISSNAYNPDLTEVRDPVTCMQ